MNLGDVIPRFGRWMGRGMLLAISAGCFVLQARQQAPLRSSSAAMDAYELYQKEYNAWPASQPPDPASADRAERYLRIAAQLDYPPAMFDYALRLCQPWGTNAPNLVEAAQWYERAASNGVPEAAYNRALLFLHPPESRRNPAAAVPWLEQASTNGLASAQLLLGDLWARGDGVPADREQAAYWFQAAARNGVPEAEYRYYLLIKGGHLHSEPDENSRGRLRAAAEGGVAEAQELLASELLESAEPEAPAEAIRWFLAAARGGNALAQWKIGRRLIRGEGSDTNLVEGAAWMLLSVDGIHREAQAELRDLERTLASAIWDQVRERSGVLRREVTEQRRAHMERTSVQPKIGPPVALPVVPLPRRLTVAAEQTNSADGSDAKRNSPGLPPESYLQAFHAELRQRMERFVKESAARRLPDQPFDQCRETVTFRLDSDGNVSQIQFQPGGTGGEFAKLLETALGIGPFAPWDRQTLEAVGAASVDLVFSYPGGPQR